MTELLEMIQKGLESQEEKITLTERLPCYSTPGDTGSSPDFLPPKYLPEPPVPDAHGSTIIQINHNYAPHPLVGLLDAKHSGEAEPNTINTSKVNQEREAEIEVIPPTDPLKALRQETAQMNAVSGHYEAQVRFSKLQQKQYDDAQLNFLRQDR